MKLLKLPFRVGSSGPPFNPVTPKDNHRTAAPAPSPSPLGSRQILQCVSSPARRFRPSPEQLRVVELCRDHNVVVSARPGSGKTATARAIVEANPDAQIAVLTYSKRLQLETARRLADHAAHCDVLTFHGLARRLFGTIVNSDQALGALREAREQPRWDGRPHDIVILDEMQDCTLPLFWLVNVFLRAVARSASAQGSKAPRLVVLGDERQAIYEYRGADSRHLSLSPNTLLPVSPYPWARTTLSRSFRFPETISNFVNHVYLGGEEYLQGLGKGPLPIYLHEDIFDSKKLADLLVPLIECHGPEQTALLAPSVQGNGPLSRLTNHLVREYKFPVAKPFSDESVMDEKVMNGKIAVSTFHGFKGSERSLVVVFGMDEAYFQYHGRDLPQNTCPNAIYVAVTRAKKQLVVVQEKDKRPLPFATLPKPRKRGRLLEYRGLPQPEACNTKSSKSHRNGVHAAIVGRHCDEEVLGRVIDAHLVIEEVSPSLPRDQHIGAPDKVVTDPVKQHYEAVSDINGMAVVASFEYATMGTLGSLGGVAASHDVPESTYRRTTFLCRKACRYEAVTSGYYSRNIQMRGHKYNWLVPYLDSATERLGERLQHAVKFELEVHLTQGVFPIQLEHPDHRVMNVPLQGFVDIRTEEDGRPVIWEIKFVSQLSRENYVQLCTYGYLQCCSKHNDLEELFKRFERGDDEALAGVDVPDLRLFNVRDGQELRLRPKNGVASLRAVLQEILIEKYKSKRQVTTEEFLEGCAKVSEEARTLIEGREA